MRLIVIITLSLFCTFLVACSESQQQTQQAQVFHCAAVTLTATSTASGLRVELPDQTYDLVPTVAASGSRYRDNDFAVEFWSKDNEATLSVNGEAYPLCIEADTLPTSFSARGNEPFWLMNVNGNEATLREPGEEQTLVDLSRTLIEEDPIATWLIRSDADIRLKVVASHCQDSMSGQSYPYTAYFERNQQQSPGCAGDPRQLLEGVTWYHVQADSELTPTIRFSPESSVHGFAGCNQYRGSYQLTGEGLYFNPLAATKMLCSPEAMAVEDEWFRKLTDVVGFRLDAASELDLIMATGEVIQLSRND